MSTQLTVRQVPKEDVEVLRREAAAQQTSLNSLLRDALAVEAQLVRSREAMANVIKEVHERRLRIAKRLGGYVPASVELIREDRDR